MKGASFLGVSAGPGGPIAHGSTSQGRPGAWLLGDDRSWSAVPDDGSTGDVHGYLSDLVPATDGSGAIAVGGIGYGPGAWVIEPGIPGEDIVEPTSEPTPESTPRPTAKPAPGATAGERYLLRGLPARIRETCVPRRESLPDGTIAAIDCNPDAAAIELTTFYLMTTKDANAVLQLRADTYGVHRKLGTPCVDGKPGYILEEGWVGTGICYLDEQGRPNLQIVADTDASCHPAALTLDGRTIRKPTVYTGILGAGGIRQLLVAYYGQSMWWAYPDGKRGPLSANDVGGGVCEDVAPEKLPQ